MIRAYYIKPVWNRNQIIQLIIISIVYLFPPILCTAVLGDILSFILSMYCFISSLSPSTSPHTSHVKTKSIFSYLHIVYFLLDCNKETEESARSSFLTYIQVSTHWPHKTNYKLKYGTGDTFSLTSTYSSNNEKNMV